MAEQPVRPSRGEGTVGSQVGVGGAMRARDVSQPREEDLREAERTVQVSRRPPRRPAQEGGAVGSSPESS